MARPPWVLLVSPIFAEGETVNPEQRTGLRGCRSTSGKRLQRENWIGRSAEEFGGRWERDVGRLPVLKAWMRFGGRWFPAWFFTRQI